MPGLQFFDSKECEWRDMTVFFAGARIAKIRGLKYKSMKDKELLYAGGDTPIGIQSGNRGYEGEIKILKGALEDINAAAIAAGGKDCLDIAFDLVVVYQAAKNRPLQTDTLLNVEIKEFEKGWDQGGKSMEITLPILFLDAK